MSVPVFAVFAGRLEQRIRNLVEEVTKSDTQVSPIIADELAEFYVESRVLGMMGARCLPRLPAELLQVPNHQLSRWCGVS